MCVACKLPPRFEAQYRNFQAWLKDLLTTPYWFEFFKVKAYILSAVSGGLPFRVSRDDVRESDVLCRRPPAAGQLVTSRRFGRSRFVRAEREVDWDRVYAHIQGSQLEEVRKRNVWNVVVAYQFSAQACLTTESLAETIGSFMSQVKQKTAHKPVSSHILAWRVQLKAARLTGCGGEEAFLRAALAHHFGSKDPDTWKFRKTQSAVGDFALAQPLSTHPLDAALEPSYSKSVRRVFRELANSSRPNWHSESLLELSRRVAFCKKLPPPLSFVFTREGRRTLDSNCANRTAKRQKIRQEARVQYTPTFMNANVFKVLGVSHLSLPYYLRPGGPGGKV